MEEPPVIPKPSTAAATAPGFANYLCSAAASATHSLRTPSLKYQVLVRCWREDKSYTAQIAQQWIYSHNHRLSAVLPVTEAHLKTVFLLKFPVNSGLCWEIETPVHSRRQVMNCLWSLGTTGEGWGNSGGFNWLSVLALHRKYISQVIWVTGTFASLSSPCATASGSKGSLRPSKAAPDSLKGISHDSNGSIHAMNASYTILPHYKGKNPPRSLANQSWESIFPAFVCSNWVYNAGPRRSS